MTDQLKKELVEEIEHMLTFPFPQVCRHSVALDMLNILEKFGCIIPSDLAKAICEGCNGDEKALELLKSI